MRTPINKNEQVSVALTPEERELLSRGLGEWGGPAHCTQELAVAMGFRDVDELYMEGERIAALIRSGESLTRFDWTRALIATEIVFASRVFGSGDDWVATTGCSDVETIQLLRQVQRKLSRARVGAHQIGTEPPRRPIK